jgi:hypothetical protein
VQAMPEYDIADPDDPNTLRVPFMFVPHGCEPTPEWLQTHPGWVRFPAVMVPRDPRPDENGPQWNVQLGAPSESVAAPAAAPAAAPEPRTSFAPVSRAAGWPVDRHGRPWPRTAFGQPQRPLHEFRPGERAPGEAAPPEDSLDYFDPAPFDPIGTFLALKRVLDDPVNAVGIARVAPDTRAKPDPNDASAESAKANDRPGVLANALAAIGKWLNPIGTANATEFQTRTGAPFSIPDSNAVAKLARNAFATAIPSGSALRKTTPGSPEYDPYAAAAATPLVFQEALASGQIFVTPSGRVPGSLLLQVEGDVRGTKGVYEYLIPIDTKFLLGHPEITHQRFIPNAPISGYPNNDKGRYPPFGGT